jgi:hypothetical protein
MAWSNHCAPFIAGRQPPRLRLHYPILLVRHRAGKRYSREARDGRSGGGILHLSRVRPRLVYAADAGTRQEARGKRHQDDMYILRHKGLPLGGSLTNVPSVHRTAGTSLRKALPFLPAIAPQVDQRHHQIREARPDFTPECFLLYW